MINEEWLKTKNTLCLRPDNFGDVLMTGPALRALKQFGDRKLTLLTSSMGSVIAKHMPEIDNVITFNVPWIKANEVAAAKQVYSLVGEIKKRKFDSAVIFTNFSQNPLPTAMLCYFAEIPLVLGYCRENPYRLINTWVPDHEPFLTPKHSVERLLDLVETIGAVTDDDHLKVSVPPKEIIFKKLNDSGLDLKSPWLVLHPGVSENKRQYNLKNYIKAGKILVRKLGYQIVITGSGEETKLAGRVAKGIGNGSYNLAGKTDLSDLIALIDVAPLLISNNTGPVHIAAATQTPVVVLYARTNPEHTPWKVRSKVLYFDVPKQIRSKNATLVYSTPQISSPEPTPEEIVSAVIQLLNLSPYAKSHNSDTNLQSPVRFSRYFNEPLFPSI